MIVVVSPVNEIYVSDEEVRSLTEMYTFLHKKDLIVWHNGRNRQVAKRPLSNSSTMENLSCHLENNKSLAEN